MKAGIKRGELLLTNRKEVSEQILGLFKSTFKPHTITTWGKKRKKEDERRKEER